MNIENLLKVSQFKGFDACFSCQHSTTHHWLHFNFVKFVPLKWYVLHFGPKRAGQPPRPPQPACVLRCWEAVTDWWARYNITQPPVRGWRLVNWWWRDTGWTLVSLSPGPLTLRSPRPVTVTGVNDQVHPRMQAKHSHTNPQISRLLHALLDRNFGKTKNSQKWFWSKYCQAQLQVSPFGVGYWLHNYTSYSFVYSIVVFLWYILVPCLTML